MILGEFNRHGLVLGGGMLRARYLRCQSWRAKATWKARDAERSRSALAVVLVAIPALILHTLRVRSAAATTQKRRRSERSTCQTCGLAFSALRAPNGKLFRAPRSKAQKVTETTTMHAHHDSKLMPHAASLAHEQRSEALR